MNSVNMKGKLSFKRVIDAVSGVISSFYFPFIVAAVTLFCYYLALDMVLIWSIALCGAFIFLFMRDATPLITLFLFMNIMISMKNSPTALSDNPSDYFFQVHIIVQIGVAICLFGGAGIFRMIADIKNGNFSLSPAFFGLCAFAVIIMFNGVFSDGYTPMNALYGFFMAFAFLAVFVMCSGSIKLEKNTYERIAWSFIALSLCLIIELAVAYATYDELWLESGGLLRVKLYFGWGMYNTIGMLFTICMPAAAYLSQKYKWGYVFTIYLAVLALCVFLSLSRQSMLCGTVIFVICAIWVLIKSKGRGRIINIAIFVATALCAGLVLILNGSVVEEVVNMLIENFFYGSGRSSLYEQAVEAFVNNPLFGVGFYRDLVEDPGFIGLPIMPDMYHNTVFQLIAVGGVFALIAYVIYRVQTMISFIKNPTNDRFYIGLTIFALLILSLLDNHIFYILPTLVYTFLTAVLIKSEKIA